MNPETNQIQKENPSKKLRVRFYPTDTEETFDGLVIEETTNYYKVIPDDNLSLIQNWNKKRCDIIR